MGLRINTNITALSAHRNLATNDSALAKSLGRLSTGLRINKAADDASGMIIADSLKSQYLGVGQAIRNASDGISIMQTADGALRESINIINTIKTKSIQAASDGQTTSTRKAIQADIDKLFQEFDAIAKTTSYNGQKLLSGAFNNKIFQVGAGANEGLNVSIGSAEKDKLGHVQSAILYPGSSHGGDIQLKMASESTGETLTLSSITLNFDNSAEHGMGALADEVNRYTSVTGIKATAVVQTQTSNALNQGETGDDFSINGIKIGAITVEQNDASGALTSAINSKTTQTGVAASLNEEGSLILTSSDNRAIQVNGAVTDVFGQTADSMSTLGHIQLLKSGVSQFQLDGIGAGASGGEMNLKVDMSTIEDSILSSGSTIAAGSMLAAGSIIGGNAVIESVSQSIEQDAALSSGSLLGHHSILAKGTELGASVIVSGNTEDNNAAANALVMLEQDMLLAKGSTLKEHSYMGAGTVITTGFTSGGVTFSVGDVLTSRIQLDSDLTLNADLTLIYNSNTNQNSGLKAGSTLAKGSETGMDVSIGSTWDITSGAVSITASAAGSTTSSSDLRLQTADVSVQGQYQFKSGSLIKDGSIIAVNATGAWDGPSLITTTGVIEKGDAIASAKLIELEGDQVIAQDFSTYSTSAATQTLKSGSIVASGFKMLDAGGGLVSNDFINVALNSAMVVQRMNAEAGSTLQGGSEYAAGSALGSSTYISGGTDSNGNAADIKTFQQTDVLAGSKLKTGTILNKGSTIGGSATLQNNSNLSEDMQLKAGTYLSYGSIFKAGTTLNQDMGLYTSDSISGANIVVNYDADFDLNPQAKAAFEYAVSIWEGLISSSVDIVIDADYEDLGGGGTLGQAGAVGYEVGSNITGAEQAGARYAMALANSIDGVDHNGALSEIDAQFNSNAGINWYFGTDGNPGAGEIDFVTVVMHEIAHGLGFLSLVQNDGSWNGGIPSIYDYFVYDADQMDVLANIPQAERAEAIISVDQLNQISWNGAFGKDANGGTNPTLYAPNVWDGGSSVSHLDETIYNGTANALMTPQLSNGEAIHAPGDIALGMMQDMGWKLASGTLIELKAGDVLTSDMTVGQNGLTLSNDQVLIKESKIAVNSIVSANTTNSGNTNLSNQTSLNLSDLNVLTQDGAQMAIEIADAALKDLDNTRANIGSVQNQFTSTISNLSTTRINLQSSESIIRDIDFAYEAMNLARLELVQQSASFALGQANTSSENILSLLQ